MGLVVTFFLGIAAMVVSYAWLGQGGPVGALVFLAILLVGGIIRVFAPQSDSSS